MKTTLQVDTTDFLTGGGELGTLTRGFGWHETGLGHPGTWPHSLRTTVSTVLASRFPMFLWWGPDLIQFYNDAYRPSLGNNGKHPTALGQRGADCWPEIWTTIKPLIDQVLTKGESTWSENQLVPIYRNGVLDEVYWTFGYSPVRDDTGQVAGVLVVTQETTQKVAATHQNEALLFAVESAGLGIWTFDPLTTMAYWDRLCGELVAADKTDTNFVDLLRHVHPADGPLIQQTAEQALACKKTERADLRCRIIDEHNQVIRWLRIQGEARLNAQGQVYRLAGTVQDITSDVLARQHLDENEQRLSGLFEQASAAICILRGPTFVVEMANERMYAMWGRTSAQLQNKPLFVSIPEAADNGFQALLTQVMTTGEPLHFSGMPASLIRNGKLETIYVNASYQPLRAHNSAVDGVMIITTEVTDLVVTQQKLQESNHRFTQLADFIPQIIWTAQPNGYVDYYNQQWYDFVGKDTGYGETGWIPILHPDDRQPALDLLKHCIASVAVFEMEYRFADHRHPSDYRWFLGRAVPITNPDGTIARWIGTATDIHEQKMQADLLEQRVAERTAALQASNQHLEQFAYIASHDLQEPLRKIQQFSHLLVTQYTSSLGDEAQDVVQRMNKAAQRMSSLINDLLDYSRLTIQPKQFRSVSLQRLVSEVMGDLEMVINEKKALVVLDSLPTLAGNAAQLRQLFQNLLTNALKFHKPNQSPLVQITARTVPPAEFPATLAGQESRPLWSIAVTDNGIGFNDEHAERIFGLFQRLHGRNQYAGTGIGLAVVQKVVENHGGAILVKSQPGLGATFVVYLWGEN